MIRIPPPIAAEFLVIEQLGSMNTSTQSLMYIAPPVAIAELSVKLLEEIDTVRVAPETARAAP